ncbi:MAG: cytochrome C [Proteobacteria bacterium]|nr:cytochrome C [Pseudomonadota bacterium]
MRAAAIVLGFSALAVASAAVADQLEDMMKKEGCNACHSESKKIVGPSYKEVAAKYRGNPKAVEMLVEKVKKGGSGVWGPIPMPPNSPRVPDADIKKMVELILALK